MRGLWTKIEWESPHIHTHVIQYPPNGVVEGRDHELGPRHHA